MATKKYEDIMKDIDELNTTIEEIKDDVSNFFNEVANSENGFNEFAEIYGNLITYTADNLNDIMPHLSVDAMMAPELAPWLAIASAVTASATAVLDYGSDNRDQMYLMPESAQVIQDYVDEFNNKIIAAEEKIERADKKANDARKYWKEIQTLVDKDGKLKNPENPKNKEAVQWAASKIKDYDENIKIEIIDDQIQNYSSLDIDKRIKEKNIKDKKEALKEVYDDEVYLNFDKLKIQLQESFNAKDDARKNYEYIKYMREETEKHHQTQDGYKYNFGVYLDAEKSAEKISDVATMNYAAISRLNTSYEKVDEMYKNLTDEEYKLTNPDYGKSPKELEWEAFKEREREARLAGAVPQASQPSPTNTITPDKTPYTNEQNIPYTAQNNIYTPEMAETVNNQFAIIPEAMREIGKLSLAAFTEGLLMDGERITEAAQELMNSLCAACNEVISSGTMEVDISDIISVSIGVQDMYGIGYEKGSEFAEGFTDSLSDTDRDILDKLMAASYYTGLELTAGQQLNSYNYYAPPQPSSKKDEKIVLQNHEDIKLVVDGAVLAKTVREHNRIYERMTGT